MADLSQLSDEDLDHVIKGDMGRISDAGLDIITRGADQRTTGEKVQDIFFGNHPKPEAPDMRSEADRANEMEAYKAHLPAAIAGAASVFTPLPEAAAGAGAAAKGAAALGRIGISTGEGAAIGALTPGDRLENAKRGAAIGGLASTAAEGIGAASSWLSDKAQAFAHEKALQAAGAMTKDFKIIHNKDAEEALGNYLLDNAHVHVGSTTKSIADSLENARTQAGRAIGNIIESVDKGSQPAISAQDIALQLSEDPAIQKLANTPGSEQVANRMGDYLNTLYKNGSNLTLKEAQELRQRIDHNINFDKTLRDMPDGQVMLTKIRNALSDRMKEAVDAFDSARGSVASGRLAQANDAYNKLAELSRIANNRVSAQSASGFGLKDYIAGAAGSATGAKIGSYLTGEDGSHKTGIGALAGGLIGALGNKVARTYGPSILAAGANSLVSPVAGAVSNVPALSPSLVGILAGTKNPASDEKSKAMQRRLSSTSSKGSK